MTRQYPQKPLETAYPARKDQWLCTCDLKPMERVGEIYRILKGEVFADTARGIVDSVLWINTSKETTISYVHY